MGYHEFECQLCNVSFCIGRIRSVDEPSEAAWCPGGYPGNPTFVEETEDGPKCGVETGCCYAVRDSRNVRARQASSQRNGEELHDSGEWYTDDDDEDDSTYEYESEEDDEPLEYDTDDSTSEADGITDIDHVTETDEIGKVVPTELLRANDKADVFRPLIDIKDMIRLANDDERRKYMSSSFEHIAGPGCRDSRAYHSADVSFDEMKHCTTVQFLARKDNSWEPESNDQDFERTSNYYLSGLAPSMPSSDDRNPHIIFPRHGLEEPEINYYAFEAEDTSMPFHPTCFEIFQRASKLAFGKIDINGLMDARNITFELSPHGFCLEDEPAVSRGSEQWWSHNKGDEYLATNPIFIPNLEPILRSAVHEDLSWNQSNGAFIVPDHNFSTTPSTDPFTRLPQEINDRIVEHLTSPEIANLRLASREFRQLRVSLWYKLLRKEIPWLWEIWSNEKPSYYASASITDLEAEKYLKPRFEAEVRSYRSIIKDEMPEIYEKWCAAEPSFEDWATISEETHAQMEVFMLPRSQTNWYELYRDITMNWGKLKGLRNRRRVWNCVETVIGQIKKYRAEGQIE